MTTKKIKLIKKNNRLKIINFINFIVACIAFIFMIGIVGRMEVDSSFPIMSALLYLIPSAALLVFMSFSIQNLERKIIRNNNRINRIK